MKGLHHSPKTEFKKGEFVGKNHPSWKGGIQKPKKDCIILWAGNSKRVRRPREIYKQYYGKIPKGFIIYHIDGKSHNDEPTNLKAISRAELFKLNRRIKNEYTNEPI